MDFTKSHKFAIGYRIQMIALDVLDALIEATYTRIGRDIRAEQTWVSNALLASTRGSPLHSRIGYDGVARH